MGEQAIASMRESWSEMKTLYDESEWEQGEVNYYRIDATKLLG